MTKSKVFFILSLAFISGIFSSSFYYPRLIDNLYLTILMVLAIILVAIFYKTPVMLAGFFILFFTLGIYWTSISFIDIKNHNEGKNFSGSVQVLSEPELKGKYQNLTVKSENGEKFLVRAGIFPEYKYGDKLKVDCKLEIPKSFGGQSTSGQSASEFDYRMYLAKDGIYYLCNNPKIENTGENKGNKIYAIIIKIKNRFNDNIMRLMPSPQSGLLSGLLIGGSGLLSKDYQNYFSLTGTTHIVAVSGYNVTIVAEYLMLLGIFIGLWRQQAFWFATIGIILFVILTGMPSSAVRAGAMGILLIWAMKNGRLANAQNAILFAASVMLLVNPLSLRWDIGFQLSFLATLGIVYVYPIMEKYFLHIVETRQCLVSTTAITEILLLTLSAQIFVLPVILFNFNKLSLISPLANILVLPIIPFTMLLGFISIFFSFIIPFIGQVFSWLAFLPLKYETVIIKFLAGLKYSSVDVTNFSWIAVVVWYIILITAIWILRKKANNPPLP